MGLDLSVFLEYMPTNMNKIKHKNKAKGKYMNKEEFKLSIMEQIEEQSPGMMLLMMKRNLKSSQRILEYEEECFYQHTPYDLLIRFSKQSHQGYYPKYQVSFNNLSESKLSDDIQIKGELSERNQIIQVVEERLELEDDTLVLSYLYTSVTQPEEGQYGLSYSNEGVPYARYILSDGEIYISTRQFKNLGRTKSKSIPEYYIDLKLSEYACDSLHEKLIAWAKTEKVEERFYDEFREFTEFLKGLKGNSDYGCVEKIIKSLRSKPLPYRSRHEVVNGIDITDLAKELKLNQRGKSRWI